MSTRLAESFKRLAISQDFADVIQFWERRQLSLVVAAPYADLEAYMREYHAISTFAEFVTETAKEVKAGKDIDGL